MKKLVSCSTIFILLALTHTPIYADETADVGRIGVINPPQDAEISCGLVDYAGVICSENLDDYMGTAQSLKLIFIPGNRVYGKGDHVVTILECHLAPSLEVATAFYSQTGPTPLVWSDIQDNASKCFNIRQQTKVMYVREYGHFLTPPDFWEVKILDGPYAGKIGYTEQIVIKTINTNYPKKQFKQVCGDTPKGIVCHSTVREVGLLHVCQNSPSQHPYPVTLPVGSSFIQAQYTSDNQIRQGINDPHYHAIVVSTTEAITLRGPSCINIKAATDPEQINVYYNGGYYVIQKGWEFRPQFNDVTVSKATAINTFTVGQ